MTVGVKTRAITMVAAITDALRTMMEEDERIVLLGEDIGQNGGVFRATEGLYQQFGEERVIDTPLAESGIIGTAVGLAINGFRPVAEMQFFGFIYPAFNQIMTHATRIRQRTMGAYSVPLVIRAPYGAGVRAPEVHSDSAEALFMHMPGMKVVIPSNPYDAKGLLIAALEDPDPVLFLEPMKCYRAGRQEVPEGKYTIELGRASRLQEGEDVSVFAWGAMVAPALAAARIVEEQEGISCEVVDLRTLAPLDRQMIATSVRKTGRAVVIHEAQRTGGPGESVMAEIHDSSFLYLRAPIARVTGYDTPVPVFSLEDDYLPNENRIVSAIRDTVRF